MKEKFKLETTSFSLHIMAMVFMLFDHLWGTIVSGNDWMTCIGRIAYPIFAFMIVEGYFHTSNLKKYVKRLLIFALISEIPFNLAMGSSIIYPFHQNVLWTFLIAIGLMHWNEKVKEKVIWKRVLVAVLSIMIGYIGGLITFVDYNHAGVLTVLVFYFFRQRKWWSYVGQFACLYYINVEMLRGFVYEITVLGSTWYLQRQGLALLALIPIWLYKGRKGYQSKAMQYVNYWFYPAHLLILGLLQMI